jgi:pyruvate formate lyase activating enzyme
MLIKGLQKISLIDFEPYACCVIFTAGCNFRCVFCHNKDLVLNPEKLETIENEEFYQFLEKRKMWLDAVCISGGEPTLHKDLPEHIARMKSMGFKVKLDSNGTNPDMVEHLIKNRLIDYVAMDIKETPEKYEEIVQVPADLEKIKRSVTLLMQHNVPYEFRMTMVPTIVTHKDILQIGQWLTGAHKFYVQQFSNKICLKKALEKVGPFTVNTLEEFRTILAKYIKHVEIRGIDPEEHYQEQKLVQKESNI